MRKASLVALAVLGTTLLFPGIASASDDPVPIPSEYVYDPSRGALNDYCTEAEDQPMIYNRELKKGFVDFRGPCARHDLCYGRGDAKDFCDTAFKNDMDQECDYAFSDDATGYLEHCHRFAETYHAAVVQFGDPGGT